MLLLAAYHLSPLKNPVILVGVHFEEPTRWYIAPNLAKYSNFLGEALCTYKLGLLEPEFVIESLEFLH